MNLIRIIAVLVQSIINTDLSKRLVGLENKDLNLILLVLVILLGFLIHQIIKGLIIKNNIKKQEEE